MNEWTTKKKTHLTSIHFCQFEQKLNPNYSMSWRVIFLEKFEDFLLFLFLLFFFVCCLRCLVMLRPLFFIIQIPSSFTFLCLIMEDWQAFISCTHFNAMKNMIFSLNIIVCWKKCPEIKWKLYFRILSISCWKDMYLQVWCYN